MLPLVILLFRPVLLEVKQTIFGRYQGRKWCESPHGNHPLPSSPSPRSPVSGQPWENLLGWQHYPLALAHTLSTPLKAKQGRLGEPTQRPPLLPHQKNTAKPAWQQTYWVTFICKHKYVWEHKVVLHWCTINCMYTCKDKNAFNFVTQQTPLILWSLIPSVRHTLHPQELGLSNSMKLFFLPPERTQQHLKNTSPGEHRALTPSWM